MERDFLGLNYKNPIVIKEEYDGGGCEDSGFVKSSGVAWPWLNKPSQFMSLKNDQDDKTLKLKSDLLASHARTAKTVSGMFESMHKRQSADIIQPNGPSAAPIHNVSMMSSFAKPHFPNVGGAKNNNMKQDGLFAPHPIPPSAAEQWNYTNNNNNSKAPSSPTQLTIFYGGTVNVFDDITPEKAQAIILLARNECVPTSNMTQSKRHMPPPLPSPMPVSGNNNDVVVLSNTAGMSTSKSEPPKMILPIKSGSASTMLSSAVPQARKASLARFLEKRKERATNAAPYNLNRSGADSTELYGLGFSSSSGL